MGVLRAGKRRETEGERERGCIESKEEREKERGGGLRGGKRERWWIERGEVEGSQ